MPHFRALLQSASRLAAAAGPREPVAATPADIAVALRHIATTRVKVALILCWFTSARPCDVLQLRKDAVAFPAAHEVKVKFTRGKVVGAVGAYHIHTQVDDDDSYRLVRDFVAAAPDGFLFPLRSGYQRQAFLTEVRLALRQSRPVLELRSLRRGSLQLLAQGGASEEELLTFSRHTTTQQLRRYLGFESVPHAAQRSGIAKAAILARGLRGGAPREFTAPEVHINDWLSVSAEGGIAVSRERTPSR